MDHEMMMLECIKQATEQGLKGEEARQEAAKMFAQITGRTLEEVKRARNLNTEVGHGSHRANVVGKDGHFDDYTRDKLA